MILHKLLTTKLAADVVFWNKPDSTGNTLEVISMQRATVTVGYTVGDDGRGMRAGTNVCTRAD